MLAETGSPSGVCAERARQLEQVERRFERDRVHLLAGPQARELRLVDVFLGADLHECAVAAHAHADGAAAHGVRAEHARLRRLLAGHVVLGVLDELRERPPELLEQRHPLALAARDRVERVFHACRELVVDVLREELGQEAVDDAADVGRDEAPILHLDVLAIAQRRDDRGVRRRPADTEFLERFDERGFRIARRRLREVLRALHVLQAQAGRLRRRPAGCDPARRRCCRPGLPDRRR